MKHKIPALTILLILLVSPPHITDASEPETIIPLEDTYIDAFSFNATYGERDYLEVSEYASGLCIAFLMFDISDVSHVLNASSEIKLRLYCFFVDAPHIVGVRWCVNNTWNEENLNAQRAGGFSRTDAEDAAMVDSGEDWYEWKVTNFVTQATEENYEKITLTLEVEDPLQGVARALYASKDQTTQEWLEYSPQLVFTYLEPEANSPDITIMVALGLAVAIVIALLTYTLSKRRTRKRRHARRKASKH